MIDIHSHLIYGVDDGASTIEESIRMIDEAEEIGVRAIIATPHLNHGRLNIEKVFNNLQLLAERAKDAEVDLRIGFEVRLSPFIHNLILAKRFLTLNSSGFALIEFPFDSIPSYSLETVYRLRLEKLTPVIAHPERNGHFRKNIGALKDFLERGCLLQLDSPSIAGAYGEKTRRFARNLIDNDMAHFVASDAHRPGNYPDYHLKAFLKVAEWAGEEVANRLFHKNGEMILEHAGILPDKADLHMAESIIVNA